MKTKSNDGWEYEREDWELKSKRNDTHQNSPSLCVLRSRKRSFALPVSPIFAVDEEVSYHRRRSSGKKENEKVWYVHTRIGAFTACHQDNKEFYSPERNPSSLASLFSPENSWTYAHGDCRFVSQFKHLLRRGQVDAIMDRCQILNVVNDIA